MRPRVSTSFPCACCILSPDFVGPCCVTFNVVSACCCQPIGRDILNWAADDKLFAATGAIVKGKSLPTHGWPLTDFASASAIAIAYLLFVIVGSAVMKNVPSMQEYTFPLRFLYNLMQVGLCSYMTIEAGILAYRNGYR